MTGTCDVCKEYHTTMSCGEEYEDDDVRRANDCFCSYKCFMKSNENKRAISGIKRVLKSGNVEKAINMVLYGTKKTSAFAFKQYWARREDYVLTTKGDKR